MSHSVPYCRGSVQTSEQHRSKVNSTIRSIKTVRIYQKGPDFTASGSHYAGPFSGKNVLIYFSVH